MTLLRALGFDEAGPSSSVRPSMRSGDHAMTAVFQGRPAMHIFRAGAPQGGASRSDGADTGLHAAQHGLLGQRQNRRHQPAKRPGVSRLQAWLGLRMPTQGKRPALGSGGKASKPLLSQRVLAMMASQRQRQRHRRTHEGTLAADAERQHALQAEATEAWLKRSSPQDVADAQELDRVWVAVMGASMGVVANVLSNNGPAAPVPALNDQNAIVRNDVPLNHPRSNPPPGALVPQQNLQRRNEPAPTWLPPTQRPAQRAPVASGGAPNAPELAAHAMHPLDTRSDPVQLGQRLGSLMGASHQVRAWFERPNARARDQHALEARGVQAAAQALEDVTSPSSSPVPRPGGGSF